MSLVILFVIPYADQPVKSGGIRTSMLNTQNILRDKGFVIKSLFLSSLCNPTYSNDETETLGIKDIARAEDISLLIYNYIKKNQPINYILFPDMGGLAFETIRAVKRNEINSKVFIQGHGCTEWNSQNNLKEIITPTENKALYLEKYCIENCDLFLPISQFYRNWLLQNNYKLQNLEIIPNFIPLSSKTDQSISELHKDKKEIIFIGRVANQKGIDLFIEALSLLNKESYFVSFFVHVNQQTYNALIEKIELIDIDYKIYSNQDSKYITNEKAVFVIPSTGGETSSMVLLESIALKRKFILSNIDPYKEIISDTNSKVDSPFFELNAFDLKQKIERSFEINMFEYSLNYSNNEIFAKWKNILSELPCVPDNKLEINVRDISIEIGIIYYNRPEFLKKLLSSLNQLTDSNCKIHILNNKGELSEDFIAECLPPGLREQFTLYKLPNEVSTSSGRNYLSEQMKSEFIVFLDDDNVLDSNFFSEVKKSAQIENSDIVTTNKYLINEQDSIVGLYSYIGGDYPLSLLENTFGDTCCLIRRTLFQKLAGFRELELFEDWDFFMRAKILNSIHSHCPAPLLHYRLHNENKTRLFDHSYYYNQFIEGLSLDEPKLEYYKNAFSKYNKSSKNKTYNQQILSYFNEKYLINTMGKIFIKPINGQCKLENLEMKREGIIYIELISSKTGIINFQFQQLKEKPVLDINIKLGTNYLKIPTPKECRELKLKTNLESFYINNFVIKYL